jgi:hypothetical protein
MTICTEVDIPAESIAGGPRSSLFHLEQSFTIREPNRLGSGVRAKLTHRALQVDFYRFPRQAKNCREFVGRFSGSDPAKALAFSTTQGRLLSPLKELRETIPNCLVIDVCKEQKGRDVGLGAPRPGAVIRLTDHRDKTKMARRVSGHRKASDQAEVGEIVPGPSLLRGEIAARSYRRPIKAHTSIKTGVIIRAVSVEEMPIPVPSAGEIEGSVLIHAPLAGRVLCRASDIACDKTTDPHLAQGVGQDAHGRVDVFRRNYLFPKLMPRTHDRAGHIGSAERGSAL